MQYCKIIFKYKPLSKHSSYQIFCWFCMEPLKIWHSWNITWHFGNPNLESALYRLLPHYCQWSIGLLITKSFVVSLYVFAFLIGSRWRVWPDCYNTHFGACKQQTKQYICIWLQKDDFKWITEHRGLLHDTVMSNLTHRGQDEMAANFRSTISNAFSWMRIHKFRLRFHWSLFLSVQLTIFQHWFR